MLRVRYIAEYNSYWDNTTVSTDNFGNHWADIAFGLQLSRELRDRSENALHTVMPGVVIMLVAIASLIMDPATEV